MARNILKQKYWNKAHYSSQVGIRPKRTCLVEIEGPGTPIELSPNDFLFCKKGDKLYRVWNGSGEEVAKYHFPRTLGRRSRITFRKFDRTIVTETSGCFKGKL